MTNPNEAINAIKTYIGKDVHEKPMFKHTIGLTKREYIAIQAFVAYIQATNVKNETIWSKILVLFGIKKYRVVLNDSNVSQITKASVFAADKMISQLNSSSMTNEQFDNLMKDMLK